MIHYKPLNCVFKLVRVNEKGKVIVNVCKPCSSSSSLSSSLSPTNKLQSGGPMSRTSNELFSLALGGYGLFGVMTEVVLKVENNVQLELDTMQLNVQPSEPCMDEKLSPSEFVRIYDNCRNRNRKTSTSDTTTNDDDTALGVVEIKLARLNTINLRKASFYVFRRSSSSPVVSDLPSKPRKLSPISRLLYKWAMPLLKDLRYTTEERTGKALDWNQDDGCTKNTLLFESAIPLTRLYSPLFAKDDTFVLQEFFCPHDKFSQWIDEVKPIYEDIEREQKEFNQDLILLNTTIRFVEQDDVTFLSYCRGTGECLPLCYIIVSNGMRQWGNDWGIFITVWQGLQWIWVGPFICPTGNVTAMSF